VCTLLRQVNKYRSSILITSIIDLMNKISKSLLTPKLK
jgi:hypothetical protein